MKQTADKSPLLFAGRIERLKYKPSLISDDQWLGDLRREMAKGTVFLLQKTFAQDWLFKVRDYLAGVGRNSLPNYEPIQKGSPNFHRLNRLDRRSYVPACFHQYSFFPWNQDVFDFFKVFQGMFRLRNLLNGLPADHFLSVEPEEGCAARLSFQFYPKGIGEMAKHADPVDFHQTVVPMLLMSKKGKDYTRGGGFIEDRNQKRIFVEDDAHIGDVVLFHAAIPHGVELVDPQRKEDWLSFEGRWTLLFAINKLMDNARISNAKILA